MFLMIDGVATGGDQGRQACSIAGVGLRVERLLRQAGRCRLPLLPADSVAMAVLRDKRSTSMLRT